MKLAALLLCAALPVAACPLSAPMVQNAEVQLVWAVVGAPMAVGRHFAIDVQLCPTSAVLARVDAWMPEHRHGMNYRPSVQPVGEGRWRVDGLMFHMPGLWELQMDVQTAVQADGGRVRLLDQVVLP